MDLPPVITNPGSSTGQSSLNAADEKLLKRARHAGRNLFVLASLATAAAIAVVATALFAKEAARVMAVLGATISLIAAGYWVLAVAGRRGNPTAVGIVIVAMVLQICLVLVLSGVSAARTGSSFQAPVGNLVIPIVVLIALASSRKVLLQLKERQLWEQVFGAAKPSGNLCLIGGVLLATGFVTMDASSYYVGAKAAQRQKADFQHAQTFADLIQVTRRSSSTLWEIFRARTETQWRSRWPDFRRWKKTSRF